MVPFPDKLVNTSMNLPQPKDLLGSAGPDHRFTLRSTGPACPSSNTLYQLEKPAHATRRPANLSLHGLFTPPQPHHNHQEGANPRSLKVTESCSCQKTPSQ
ncbi:hypothetical protein ILYODFUR_034925 [Ilyodon furcidens]|uniref:Uncharacterized protein n=1 Tax=Ilyodon furcidens TaxID=33524 RepID=A0ABV0SRM9_9TELE